MGGPHQMTEDKTEHLSIDADPAKSEEAQPARRRQRRPPGVAPPGAGESARPGEGSGAAPSQGPPPSPPWFSFLRHADNKSTSHRFASEMATIQADLKTRVGIDYCLLGLLDSETSISDFELDRIYSALQRTNPTREKDVLLLLLTRGGSIEPAYQISKLCKSFAHEKFVVVVPRYAKSAGTLLALGADEIHMGPLGHLGPIDPQLGGLPALGVSQALKSIAALSEQFPGSADMFARYLRLALTVEQIGYYERVSESAAQYAERLLQAKTTLPKPARAIADELVHEYKDHGFVIDLDEARQHLGTDWVKTGTPEVDAGEQIYSLFDHVNLFLGLLQQKRLLVSGTLAADDVLVFDRQRR